MKKRLIGALVLIAYGTVLIKVMVFKAVPAIRVGQLMLNFGGTESGKPANFVPFKTILPYLLGYKGWIIAGINLVGNIALLVPLGFLLSFAFRNITWKKTLAVAVTAGLLIETMQTALRVGIFDIDDVILNALGVMVGFAAYLILAKWVRERKYVHIIVAAIVVIGAAAGAFYAIYPHGEPLIVPDGGDAGQFGGAGNEQEGAIPQSGDPCGGTGGTGEIVDEEANAITIKRQDGVIQTINLTAQTDIRNSAGPIPESDLKIGDHVTVVVLDENDTASTVLVCNAPETETQSGG
ncbi:MAG TPA: VanZ family protein [Candidatus Paceibacterota bacterium]|jgi:glycopeptide antibiotics resistance protein|nr:VanZ family protein [Candidatus Paceibacterota bacterium]